MYSTEELPLYKRWTNYPLVRRISFEKTSCVRLWGLSR
jgi:hypothetical protein